MANTVKKIDSTTVTRSKRLRSKSSNDISSNSDDHWLRYLLNDVEEDPKLETWNGFFQESSQTRQKQNSEITFPTPYIFKSVNPQNLVNNTESNNSQRRQGPFTTSFSSFSTNLLSEDLVGKVVEVLGIVLDDFKLYIWNEITKKHSDLPGLEGLDPFIHSALRRDYNKFVNDPMSSQLANSLPTINDDDQIRHYIDVVTSIPAIPPISPMVSTYSVVDLFRNILNFYCQKTSFVTVIQMLFDAIALDFMREDSEVVPKVEDFMKIFHEEDNFSQQCSNMPFNIDQLQNKGENIEAFTWFYHSFVKNPQYQFCTVSTRFQTLGVHFTLEQIEQIESILSMFYTKHFLNVLAKEQQKDHGQFYTPREVMIFMWDRVLVNKGNETWLDKLLVTPLGCLPQAPSVLDPCMGIGSFLCEFISRLTLAAQKCPNVWNNSRAISNLLLSLSKNLWGIEIDVIAYLLCKINITLHIIPLFKRFIVLNNYINDIKLERLHLFRNDTLNLYLPEEKGEHAWECENLQLLRSPQNLKFDFIVTNPPYMIRKTGFISEPDSELFDERVLGKGGMQAYAYFFWFCVERCKEETGEICLISASQWMGLEFADKLRAWLWNRCHLVEFFQFEPFKVWRKIQTDSLIFRLRRRREILTTGVPSVRPALSEPKILFLRYMNRKASLQETLQAYNNFNPNQATQFEKDMHHKLTPPYPQTQLPSQTNSFSFTFLMPSSEVSTYLRTITSHLPSLCDHASMKHTWVENNPLIWHRGPNTNPVYALVVRTNWAYSKFGTDVCRRWLRPVFYWNGKNGGKEAEFWQKMGDELRLEKKESSPAEAYVPFISYNSGGTTIAKGGLEQDKSMYSLIMVDRDAVDKVRRDFGEHSEFWKYLKEARIYLQTGMNSREIAYCGTSKCGIDFQTKIIHPINYGYFSKNQPRQRFFIDEDNVCVTNQYDQQGRMRLFRENMAKIPYAAPTDSEGVDWFIKCVEKMTKVRQMLYEGIQVCDEEEKVASAVVEKLRRGAWQLSGREWQERGSDAINETSVVLREEQDGNWVMVRQFRGRGDGVEYSLCPGSGEQVPRHDEAETGQTSSFNNHLSSAEVAKDHRSPTGNLTKTHVMKPFFEALLYASACLQYGIDQYTYTLYGIDVKFQMALEEELKLELFEAILSKYPRLNGIVGTVDGVETRGMIPEWGERLYEEVEMSIDKGQRQKRILLQGHDEN
ncbi:1067_t:CDS:2 [Funneliformis geosporum]|nr:1067_t:CDS:2 [Funneliformis geosporum]